ncbi:MAG: hypothetical protein HYX92_01130 [Chloroflexi bacterium]|nr:hypothetical protein [Chloroflexota bacterium]
MGELLENPIGEVTAPGLKLARRPDTLDGKVMGILNNKRGQADLLLERIADRLSERYRLAGTETRTLAGPSGEAIDGLNQRADFVIAGFGCSGVYTIWCVQASVELEKRGTPTVMVCTSGLDAMCQAEARRMGLAEIPLLSLPLPEEGSFTLEDLHREVDIIVDDIVFALTQPADNVAEVFRGTDLVARAEKSVSRPTNYFSQDGVDVASAAEATSLFYQRGWTDGLPILPPTREAVEAMLTYNDREPDEVVACLAPRMGRATAWKIAVNAVMAGCLPEYLPVIVAALQAMAEPKFNLSGLQATTNPVAPIAIVNGPLAKELMINSGCNVFGQGWRANATIGRAIRLCLMNIGGGVPGTTDMALQGHPGKYAFCIAENEEETPWESLHVEKGFPRDTSTVTVAGVQAFHNVLTLTAETILPFSADAMALLGSNALYHGGGWPILALNPQSATALARHGYSKADVKQYLYDHANIPLSRFPVSARDRLDQRQIRKDAAGETVVQATGRAEDIIVVVVGAPGVHSQYLATMGHFIQPVTRAITRKDGTFLRQVKDLKAAKD